MNIKQANALSVEEMDKMTDSELLEVVQVLKTSKAKQSRLKLDIVQGLVEKRKKSANKVEQQSLDIVENSVKQAKETMPKKQREKNLEFIDSLVADKEVKAGIKEYFEDSLDDNASGFEALAYYCMDNELNAFEYLPTNYILSDDEVMMLLPEHVRQSIEETQAELETDGKKLTDIEALICWGEVAEQDDYVSEILAYQEERKPVEKPKKVTAKKNEPKKAEASDKEDLLARIEMLEIELEKERQEKAGLKGEMFPEELDGLKKLEASDLKELQKLLMHNPYKLYLLMHEGIDEDLTLLHFIYLNDEILVAVDKTREVNSTLTITANNFNLAKKYIKYEGKHCPTQLYIKA